MEFTKRSEVGYMDEDPASGNPGICREIRAALAGRRVEKPLAEKDKKKGNLEDWL